CYWCCSACDAWMVARPTCAQASERSSRICRMCGFLPRYAAMAALMTRTSSSLSPSAAARGAAAAGRAADSSAATRSLNRPTSRRSASTAAARRARSTASVAMAPSGSQGDQAVLLRRPAVALRLQVLQRLRQVLARVGRLDDVVHQAAAGGHVRRRERGAVLLDQFRPAGG